MLTLLLLANRPAGTHKFVSFALLCTASTCSFHPTDREIWMPQFIRCKSPKDYAVRTDL